MSKILSIDIETYCELDITKVGAHAYVQHPSFEILLFGCAWDTSPVRVVDLAQGGHLPADVLSALRDPAAVKTAWNAAFERAALSVYLGRLEGWEGYNPSETLPPGQWSCSMVQAYYMGLPGRLDRAAEALKLEHKKDAAGTRLINYFSKPCPPTKANGGRTRNLPEHDPERWQKFIEYCRQDVTVERAIRVKIQGYPLPEREQRLWGLDQKINDAGIRIDGELVRHALACGGEYRSRLLAETERLTQLGNPNSVDQMKGWLKSRGMIVESLNREAIPDLLNQTSDPAVKQVLNLRQGLAKTSVRKYEAMKRAMGGDSRVRGTLQFYGAARTGRWAGRLLQTQNLPRSSIPDLHEARQILKTGHHDAIEMLWGDVPQVLSQLIRTAIVPSAGHRFIVVDFSAIEARVVAWLAGEDWVLDVFRGDGRIYEATAAQMFGVPVDSIERGSPERGKGKLAVLACGYQGGPKALEAMGAVRAGIPEEDLVGIVHSWRRANPRIVQFWYDSNDTAMAAVQERTTITSPQGIEFKYKPGLLRIRLPSGRHLHYVRPRIEEDPRFNRLGLTFEGYEFGQWRRVRTFGGKLVENITQAVARDCLAEALLRLDEAGYRITFHVHDEAVLDVPEGHGSVEEVVEVMIAPMPWAPDLPLAAEGFETDYYR